MAISVKDHVMPPRFFQKGHKVNKEVYLALLSNVEKPWMDRCSEGRPNVFQQNSALAHASNLVQNWLTKTANVLVQAPMASKLTES